MKSISCALAMLLTFLFISPGSVHSQTLEAVPDFLIAIEGHDLAIEQEILLANDQVSPDSSVRISKPPLRGTLQATDTGYIYSPPSYSIQAQGGSDSFVYMLFSDYPPFQEVTAKVTVRVAPGQVPLAGRWMVAGTDCQNDETLDHLGWYDSASGELTLCRLANAAINDCEDFLLPGGPGLTPLIGDWDGDGCEEPGTYDSTSSSFVLYQFLNSQCTLPPNGDCMLSEFSSFSWGERSSEAIVGDWNGDGIDTVGLRQPDGSRIFSLLEDHLSESEAEVFEAPEAIEPLPIVLRSLAGDQVAIFDDRLELVIESSCEDSLDLCLELPDPQGPQPLPVAFYSSKLPFTGYWGFGQSGTTSIGIFDPSAADQMVLYAVTGTRPPKILTIPIDTSGR